MRSIKVNSLFIIIAAGFVLRLWGLDFGLPYQFHQDEPIVINHAFAFGSGDLNPHFFIIPPFCSYLVFFFYGLFFVIGKIFGLFSGTEQFALKFFSDPAIFYLIARLILGLIPGTLIIPLVYFLYKKLFGRQGALFAASTVAVSFLCVVNAHYAYLDNWLVVFILTTYIALLEMTANPSLKNYILAAVFLGLAGSAKYNAAFLVASFMTANAIIAAKKPQSKKFAFFMKYLFLTGFIALIVFVITNPFSVIDKQLFLNNVLKKIRIEYVGWLHHIVYSLNEGMGSALVLTGLLGFLAIILNRERSRGVFFISFPVIFYLQLAIRSQKFSRYVLPLVPFLAIAAGFFIFQVALPKANSPLKRKAVLLLSLLLLAGTLVKTIKADLLFSADDTRIQAKEWIEENIPVNIKIAMDHTFFRPPVPQTKEQILEKYSLAESQKELKALKEKKIGFLLASVEGKKTYAVFFLKKGPLKKGQFLSMSPAIEYNLDLLKGSGIQFVVINYNTAKADFIRKLNEKADVVAEFSPYYDEKIRFTYDAVDLTALPVGAKELFSRRLNGPALQIYKLKTEIQ